VFKAAIKASCFSAEGVDVVVAEIGVMEKYFVSKALILETLILSCSV
jgi:hypothetical protein